MLESAYAIAQEYGSPLLVPEHFVLSALRDRNGYAFKILSQLHIPIDRMVSELEEHVSTMTPQD